MGERLKIPIVSTCGLALAKQSFAQIDHIHEPARGDWAGLSSTSS
jgi:hypothetical protein